LNKGNTIIITKHGGSHRTCFPLVAYNAWRQPRPRPQSRVQDREFRIGQVPMQRLGERATNLAFQKGVSKGAALGVSKGPRAREMKTQQKKHHV